MLFNSLDFAIFLPIVFILYWFVFNRSIKVQNAFVVAASYYFYGSWNVKFLSLIVLSTVVDYVIALRLHRETEDKKRKLLLGLSLFVNLGLLGFFKYFNFFVESFVDAFSLFGFSLDSWTLNVLLPVGISFYTFQTLSYSIDVYRRKIEPTSDFIAFAAFVSFFPQLVAGPIERAKDLLPQFYEKRVFDYNQAADGCRQILWGLFKKIVIADNCAVYVNDIFAAPTEYGSGSLLLGAVFFAFQIYGDFSGYSDIAIGVSRLFGFNLKQNFAFPYFSRDIAEFWRRWHISLSSWFKDYLYIPLGGSRGGLATKIRNTFIIFLVSGIWHGANWTFVAWGFFNALLFIPLLLVGKNRNNIEVVASNSLLPSLKEVSQIGLTFFSCCILWVFFRADSISSAFEYLSSIVTNEIAFFSLYEFKQYAHVIFYLIVFITIEWIGRKGLYGIELIGRLNNQALRYCIYFIILFLIFVWAAPEESPFIYFQF